MDILACPICKSYPLELHVFEENEEIVTGMMMCVRCFRWYPIIEEIPYMLPDELRTLETDLAFMRKWKDQFPSITLKQGKPLNEQNL